MSESQHDTSTSQSAASLCVPRPYSRHRLCGLMRALERFGSTCHPKVVLRIANRLDVFYTRVFEMPAMAAGASHARHKAENSMADTHEIKRQIEPYVRGKLSERFGVTFSKRMLPLTGCDGVHEFDAVSEDGRIVASVKSSSGRTSGQRNPSGKFHASFEELYSLSLVAAEQRLLVLTSHEFFDLFKKRSEGRIVPGIELWHCPLSPELELLIGQIASEASDEIDRGKRGIPPIALAKTARSEE